MTRVIALSREHGSGGAEIASRVAAALGWKLVDKTLLAQVARHARIPAEEAGAYDERVDPWLVRLVRGFASGSPDSYAGLDAAGVVDAAAEVERVDRERAAYARRYFGCSFGDRACFDLMADSSLGIDRVVATILAAMSGRPAGSTS